jgi:hypothetical protein
MKNISDWKNNYQNAGKGIQKDNGCMGNLK